MEPITSLGPTGPYVTVEDSTSIAARLGAARPSSTKVLSEPLFIGILEAILGVDVLPLEDKKMMFTSVYLGKSHPEVFWAWLKLKYGLPMTAEEEAMARARCVPCILESSRVAEWREREESRKTQRVVKFWENRVAAFFNAKEGSKRPASLTRVYHSLRNRGPVGSVPELPRRTRCEAKRGTLTQFFLLRTATSALRGKNKKIRELRNTCDGTGNLSRQTRRLGD